MLHRGFFQGHCYDLTLPFLAKSEVQNANSGIEELDFKSAVLDFPLLADELIQTRLSNFPSAVGGGISAATLAGSLAVQYHLKANGLAVFRRSQDEVKVRGYGSGTQSFHLRSEALRSPHRPSMIRSRPIDSGTGAYVRCIPFVSLEPIAQATQNALLGGNEAPYQGTMGFFHGLAHHRTMDRSMYI